MQYDDYRDANAALSGSMIMLNGEPIYVRECRPATDGTIDVLYQKMPTSYSKIQHIPLSDPGLNYTNYLLGYVNLWNYGAVYMSRLAARRNRQGANQENILFTGNPYIANITTVLQSEDATKCLKGEYPSIKEALDMLELVGHNPVIGGSQNYPSVAFSRVFALKKDKLRNDHVLMYKGDEIGWGRLDTYITPAQNAYLHEVIREQGIKIR